MKVLIISYFFIPSTSANAKRPYYIAKGLLDAGWDVDVLSSDSLLPENPNELLDHPNFTIHRIKDPYFILNDKIPTLFRKIMMMLVRGLLWPDPYLLWSLKIIRKINTSQYDRIFVCIMPISLIIFSLFKKVTSSWVFDYSESYSPKRVVGRKSPLYYIMKPFLAHFQRRILKKSGPVLFTSEVAIKDYLKYKLLDANKAISIPLFFNNLDYKGGILSKNHFIITYTGVFGIGREKRSPLVFFQALKLFLKENPEAQKQTKFIFYGRWRERDTPLISKYKLEKIVQINSAVPLVHYLKVLESSAVLLLITDESDNMFVPSKMLDYFGAKRPILAFVPSNSETYSILKNAKMNTFHAEPTDPEKGSKCLEDLWKKWKNGNLSCDNSQANQWSFSFQMPKILAILNKKGKS